MYIWQCGHVPNNLHVLYFIVFVSRFVTALLCLYHRRIVQLDVLSRPCACSQEITQPVSVAVDFLSRRCGMRFLPIRSGCQIYEVEEWKCGLAYETTSDLRLQTHGKIGYQSYDSSKSSAAILEFWIDAVKLLSAWMHFQRGYDVMYEFTGPRFLWHAPRSTVYVHSHCTPHNKPATISMRSTVWS